MTQRVGWIATKGGNWLLITMDTQRVVARLKHRRRDDTWTAYHLGAVLGEHLTPVAACGDVRREREHGTTPDLPRGGVIERRRVDTFPSAASPDDD